MKILKIKSINRIKNKSKRYDIEVNNVNNFYANKILVHNCQNIDMSLYSGERVYITEKLDGTSFTCYFNNGVFGVCGRNWELTETNDNSLWRMANMLELKDKLTKLGKNIAIQGELVGSGINGNLYQLTDHKLFFFTGYDIDNRRRMSFDELEWVLFKLDLNMVPVLEFNYNLPIENLVEYMLRYAEGKSVLNMEVDREGVVVRGLEREFSFKAISNTYLLGSKD
jgi:RNA ligase (TIGR02306 family)